MATIPLPSTAFKIRSAGGGYEYAQGVATCPYTLKTLVQDFGGKRRRVTIEVPPMTETQAAQWTEFFEDLSGMVNTFNLDLTDIYPHDTGATSVAFRLAEPNASWNADVAKHFGFTLEAIEVV